MEHGPVVCFWRTAETSEAPVDSMAVDKMMLKKAETRNSTVKTKQVIAFFSSHSIL